MKLILPIVCLVLPILAWHDGNHLLRMDRNIKHLLVNPTQQQSLLVVGYMDAFVELFEYLVEKMVALRDSAKEAAEFFFNKRPNGPKFANLPAEKYEHCKSVFQFDNETNTQFNTFLDLTKSLWPVFTKELKRLEGIETNKSDEEIIFGQGP